MISFYLLYLSVFEECNGRTKKTFGLFDAFNIGIGAIIGAGIFVITGIGVSLAGRA